MLEQPRQQQDKLITQFQKRITALEQENSLLKQRVADLPELEKRYLLLEYRDRIFEATTSASNALLTIENFDEAVNTALQIIGEKLDSDRVTVIQNLDSPANDLPQWKVVYEWHSPHTVPQISHPNLAQGSYEGVQEWYVVFSQGEGVSFLLEEMPEPFRSGQAELGVKALHVVPIFVKSEFWGVIGFDDCREAKRRSLAELAVLKTAAACIGSAIESDRTRQALLQAEQERTAQLEQINAELRQALDKLAESEERFRTLFEYSSEGFNYVEFDPPYSVTLPIEEQCELYRRNLRVIRVNPAFAAMYGVENPDDLMGLKIADFHIENSEKNVAFIRAIVENGYRARNIETEEIDKHGKLRYFLNSGAIAIKDNYVVNGWGTQVDITELRETQQALLHAEKERVAELAKANHALRESLRSLATNPELDTFLGYLLLEMATQINAVKNYLFLYNQSTDTLSLHTIIRDGKVFSKEANDFAPFSQPISASTIGIWQLMIEQKSPLNLTLGQDNPSCWPGSYEWHRIQGHQGVLCVPLILGEEALGFLGLAYKEKAILSLQDTELAQALAHQVTLAIQLTRLAEESRQAVIFEERNRMAREIHDTLAQAFAGIGMQLQAVNRFRTSDPDKAQIHFDRAYVLTQIGLSEARRSVWALSQEGLEYSDLFASVTRITEQLTSGALLQPNIEVQGTPYNVEPEVGLNLLRIAQEALTNALRHAQAQNIQIQITYEPSYVRLVVRDDGHGFDPQLPVKGFGLASIQQRADHIGAQLRVFSQLGSGTEIVVIFPMPE
ncbi:GAF domain-containing protein [Aerosakkonemataceae cyanobacterium BLCC-F50]|uniref:GAF domain-containing protein n=2 Tax=Floridanema TaxID=3396149 RepID=A0ABV4XZ49_9CYAN